MMTAVYRWFTGAAAFMIIAAAACGLSSCGSSKGVEQVLTPEEQYAKAMAEYNDGNYLDAIEALKTITVQYQGTSVADAAQFYIGESRYNRGEYILAAAEYDNLIRSMPSSKYVSQARYKRAMSYYEMSPKPQLDQKYTKLAIDDFQTFLEYAPADSLAKDAEAKVAELTNKLAEKIFESGRLYYRREYFKAAIVYFDNVIDVYHDTRFADAAMYWKACAQRERRDYDAALATIDQLFEKYPSSPYKGEAQTLRGEVEQLKHEPRADSAHNERGGV